MALRKIIEIDKEKCDACGICIPSCAEQALIIEDNELKIIEDKLCDGLGACLNSCPKDALKIIEREADAYDHAAVEALIEAKLRNTAVPASCQSLQEINLKQENIKEAVQSISPQLNAQIETSLPSALENWPVKLSLVSSKVSFLNTEKLTIVADCAAFACASFHKRYTKGAPILILCPRLENKEALVEKMAEIFRLHSFKQLDIIRMEVPCCVIPDLILKAYKLAEIEEKPTFNLKVITRKGQELMQNPFAQISR